MLNYMSTFIRTKCYLPLLSMGIIALLSVAGNYKVAVRRRTYVV